MFGSIPYEGRFRERDGQPNRLKVGISVLQTRNHNLRTREEITATGGWHFIRANQTGYDGSMVLSPPNDGTRASIPLFSQPIDFAGLLKGSSMQRISLTEVL